MSLRNRWKLSVILAFFIVLFPMAINTQAQSENEPEDPIAAILKRIETSGEYNFIAQIEQTLIPRPIPANFGKSEERIDSQLTGEVVLPDYSKLTWQFEAGAEVPPIIFEQDGAKTYLIQEGERTEIENPMAGMSPSNDFATYLYAADNIRLGENNQHPEFTTYLFDVNGAKLADYFMAEARRNLPPAQQNTLISPSTILQNVSGQGELWVDADGYPQRQILDITMPEVNDQYDSQSHIVVDFQFDSPLTGVPLVTAGNLGVVDKAATGEIAIHATEPPPNHAEAAPATTLFSSLQNVSPRAFLITLLSIIIILAFTLSLARSHRWLRISVPFSLAAIMIATPTLQPISHAREREREAALAPPLLCWKHWA